jgi:hypothetical protein
MAKNTSRRDETVHHLFADTAEPRTVQLWALQDAVSRMPPPTRAGERRSAAVGLGDRDLWQTSPSQPGFILMEFVAVEYTVGSRRWLAWELPVA